MTGIIAVTSVSQILIMCSSVTHSISSSRVRLCLLSSPRNLKWRSNHCLKHYLLLCWTGCLCNIMESLLYVRMGHLLLLPTSTTCMWKKLADTKESGSYPQPQPHGHGVQLSTDKESPTSSPIGVFDSRGWIDWFQGEPEAINNMRFEFLVFLPLVKESSIYRELLPPVRLCMQKN